MSKAVEAFAEGVTAVFTYGDFAAESFCLPTNFDPPLFLFTCLLKYYRETVHH